MKTIKKILNVQSYKLTLEFNNNEIRTIDLEELFKKWSQSTDSKFRELLIPENFVKVKLNQEIESIYWDNGVDLCPDMLYKTSKENFLATASHEA